MYSILNISAANSYVKDFVADTEDDVAKLPTSKNIGTQPNNPEENGVVKAGSTCLVITPPSLYMLGSDDVWHKL